MNTIEVGQTLYKELEDRSGKFLGIKEYTVTEVKNKYFYVNDSEKRGFDKTTLKHTNKQWMQFDVHLFRTKEEILDRLVALPLIKILQNHIGTTYTRHSVKYTSEQMKQVLQILNIPYE